MIATFDTVLAEAPSFPADNWPHMIKRHSATIQITPDLEAAQIHEVRRRIGDVRTGRVSTIPGEQVFSEIQQSLAGCHSA